VAVHDRSLIDFDADEQALYRRVRAKYGNTAVLIMPADGPREIRSGYFSMGRKNSQN